MVRRLRHCKRTHPSAKLSIILNTSPCQITTIACRIVTFVCTVLLDINLLDVEHTLTSLTLLFAALICKATVYTKLYSVCNTFVYAFNTRTARVRTKFVRRCSALSLRLPLWLSLVLFLSFCCFTNDSIVAMTSCIRDFIFICMYVCELLLRIKCGNNARYFPCRRRWLLLVRILEILCLQFFSLVALDAKSAREHHADGN